MLYNTYAAYRIYVLSRQICLQLKYWPPYANYATNLNVQRGQSGRKVLLKNGDVVLNQEHLSNLETYTEEPSVALFPVKVMLTYDYIV